MAQFHIFLTELSAHHTSVFSVPDGNVCKDQYIFTKLVMDFHQTWYVHSYCGDWFGIAVAKFQQFLTKLSAHHTSVFSVPDGNVCKYQCIFTKLVMDFHQTWYVHSYCGDWFGIAVAKFHQFLTKLSARYTILAGIVIPCFFYVDMLIRYFGYTEN